MAGQILIRLEAIERELLVMRMQAGGTLTTTPADTEQSGSGANDSHQDREGTRPPLRSRINRDGLAEGAVAPQFSARLLNESADLQSSTYAGKQHVVILATLDCAPCDSLMSELARLPQDTIRDSVLIVTRGALEENRRKFEAYRLSCPVVCQAAWEISRLYGTFSFPSAYLIDERGVIAAAATKGSKAILEMVSRAFPTSSMRGGGEVLKQALSH